MHGLLAKFQNSNMDKLRVGIAGYGIVGKRRENCINNNPYMELIGVCDKSFDESGTFQNGIKYFPTVEDLLNINIDVLIICLPNNIASSVTEFALNAGLHVFCEKPPGRNLEDIARVMETEKRNKNSLLMYGFNHRYHDSVKDALKLVKSEKYGKIINLRGVYGKSKIITFNQSNWRTKREISGGGVLLDQGIHMVDLMRLFAGEFVDVHSFISNKFWEYDVEDNAYAIMKTKEGIVGMLNSSATQWRHRFNLDINLENGSIILGGLLTGTKSYGSETLIVTDVDHDKDSGNPREYLTRYNYDPSWQNEMDDFADSIINNKPLKSGSSQDAFDTMKLVYSIYYADKSWRTKFNISNPSNYK